MLGVIASSDLLVPRQAGPLGHRRGRPWVPGLAGGVCIVGGLLGPKAGLIPRPQIGHQALPGGINGEV
jgi:hypothetical protein